MTEENLTAEELDELNSIANYIEILLNKFPNPITQTELAKEASVTKSAISKIREKLVTICDLKFLAYEKKLLLSLDSKIFVKLFFFFVFNRLKPEIILKSNYLKSIVDSWNIHERFSKNFEGLSYREFFEKEDTNKIIEIGLHNLSNIRVPQIFSHSEIRKTKMNELGLLLRILAYFPILEDPFSKIDLAIFDNEEELFHLLRIRDKIFYFIMHNSKKMLRNWEVLQNIDEENKDVYLKAYIKAIEHYVRKYANQFNSKVKYKAKKMGIDFKSQYSEIGSFYKATNKLDGDICHSGRKRESHPPNPGSGEISLSNNME